MPTAVVFSQRIVLFLHPKHKLLHVVIPQAFLRARLRLERPLHSEKTQNYISHVQQLQFFLFLIAAEWDLTTVFQAANGIHTPNTDLKTGLQSKLGTTFSAEKMSPRNGLKSTIRSGRPEKSCEVAKI